MNKTDEAADFPDWFSPMLVKDLRQGLRSRWFTVVFIWVQASMCGLVAYQTAFSSVSTPDFIRSGIMHVLFFGNITLILHLLLPLRVVFMADADVLPGNLPLLRLTGLFSERVAMSKFLVGMFLMFVTLMSMLPYVLVRYYLNHVEIAAELVAVLWLAISSAIVNAWALLLSILPTVVRAVLTAVLLIFVFPIFEALVWGSIYGSRASDPSGLITVVMLWVILGSFACALPLAIVEARLNDRPYSMEWSLHRQGVPSSS